MARFVPVFSKCSGTTHSFNGAVGFLIIPVFCHSIPVVLQRIWCSSVPACLWWFGCNLGSFLGREEESEQGEDF